MRLEAPPVRGFYFYVQVSMKSAIALSIIFSVSLSSTVTAAALTGVANVTDGDTIRIGQSRIRLFGMDAPEKAQRCERDGACYRCGDDATRALKSIVGDSQVTCSPTGAKTYGRIVATCEAGGVDLSVEMVRQGWALPYWRYLSEVPTVAASIVAAYSEAKLNGSGIHAGEFVTPSDWRHKKARVSCE